MEVPFFRPSISEREIDEVVATLRSGWLTTGSRVRRFEEEFRRSLRADHAVALNSCTAALHLALDALGLRDGEAVLVPTMTFAATAEVVQYFGAVPVLVDCDPVTLNLDLNDAARKIEAVRSGALEPMVPRGAKVVGLMPVHVGGYMVDVAAIRAFAAAHELWVVEDAAHAFPAAWRADASDEWTWCGAGTAEVTCFSFYANKPITTGEGGMAVTANAELASRMRQMSLHGLSNDAWRRFSKGGAWDYKIVQPGFKYNLTDVAAALGIHQLARAEELRLLREKAAASYLQGLAMVGQLELPPVPTNRIPAWHLFPVRLRLDRLSIDRARFIDALKTRGVATSVHWRPLHLHPYYRDHLGWPDDLFPAAGQVWPRLVSLPIFPDMTAREQEFVVAMVTEVCREHALVAAAH